MQLCRWLLCWLTLLGGVALSCRESEPGDRREPAWLPKSKPLPAASITAEQRTLEISLPNDVSLPAARSPSPVPSEVLAVEKEVRASKLALPPIRQHEPHLAFGRGAVAQLTHDALRIHDSSDFHELLKEPLQGPRVVLALADGGIVALGSRHLLLWQPGWKHTKKMARPMVLPGVDVYADAERGDRLWVFDGQLGAGPPKLMSYLLIESQSEDDVPLPEQSIELASPRGGVFGVSREGVWLYSSAGRLERFGPGGARLSEVPLPDQPLPTWMLAAPRLDQAVWLDESGQARRVLVTPAFRRLGKSVSLSGPVLSAAVGDQGRLLAFVVITGPGPRFELELRDAALTLVARVSLPSDSPSTGEDWVRGVTENQGVAVALHSEQVAVGGPGRLAIFDGEGRQTFFKSFQ